MCSRSCLRSAVSSLCRNILLSILVLIDYFHFLHTLAMAPKIINLYQWDSSVGMLLLVSSGMGRSNLLAQIFFYDNSFVFRITRARPVFVALVDAR